MEEQRDKKSSHFCSRISSFFPHNLRHAKTRGMSLCWNLWLWSQGLCSCVSACVTAWPTLTGGTLLVASCMSLCKTFIPYLARSQQKTAKTCIYGRHVSVCTSLSIKKNSKKPECGEIRWGISLKFVDTFSDVTNSDKCNGNHTQRKTLLCLRKEQTTRMLLSCPETRKRR